jgi:hypothetical protein
MARAHRGHILYSGLMASMRASLRPDVPIASAKRAAAADQTLPPSNNRGCERSQQIASSPLCVSGSIDPHIRDEVVAVRASGTARRFSGGADQGNLFGTGLGQISECRTVTRSSRSVAKIRFVGKAAAKSGRPQDSLIGAEISLIGRFNSL